MRRGIALKAGLSAALLGITLPACAEGDVQPKPTGPVFTDPLPSEPKAIVSAFFKDHTAWNAFALNLSEGREDMEPARESFKSLLNLYCGPAGKFHRIYFHKDLHLTGGRSAISGEREEEGRRVVEVRHEDPDGFVTLHEFVFLREEAGWRLKEVFVYDHFTEEWYPSLCDNQ